MKPGDVEKINEKLRRQGGFWTWNDVLDAIERQEMKMFAVGESFAVVRICKFPRRTVIDVVLVWGVISDMRRLEEAVEIFKEAAGASAIFASGRHGWSSLMHGSWKAVSVNYMKE